MKDGELKSVPQWQRSKGSLIVTAALELSTNQVTHFYSKKKNTGEMIKLIEILLGECADQSCIYLSWDAASWHASKRLFGGTTLAQTEGLRQSRKLALAAFFGDQGPHNRGSWNRFATLFEGTLNSRSF